MTEFPLINAAVFAGLGILVFIAAAALVARILPFDVWKLVVEEHSVPVAILAGSAALALAWIIAATMH